LFDDLVEAYRLKNNYRVPPMTKAGAFAFAKAYACQNISSSLIYLKGHDKSWHPDIYDAAGDMARLRDMQECNRSLFKDCHCYYNLLAPPSCIDELLTNKHGNPILRYIGPITVPYYERCTLVPEKERAKRNMVFRQK
jgi:hypothetical protein